MPGRTSVVAALALLSCLALGPGLPTAAAAADDPGPPPLAYLVADAGTGAIVAARDEHRPLPPASTMKLMTAVVGLEKLSLASTIRVSALAAAQPAMRIGMHEGEAWPMTDALHSLLMVSANDAAYAIVENASGTLDRFAADMQAEATRFGMHDSSLSDPAGLDAEGEGFGGGSTVSAYDMAIVARNALAVPAIAEAARLLDYGFTGPDGVSHTLHSHNDTWLQGYAGATGMKPGFTKKANRTLVASATRNGRSCVAVVLGIYDIEGWATRLEDQCFGTAPAALAGAARLPPVRVATLDDRHAAVAGLPRVLGAPGLGVAAAAPARAARPASVNPAPNLATAAATRPSSSGFLSLRHLVLGLAALAIVLVALRRRAVTRRRQQRRRIAERAARRPARRPELERVGRR